MTEPFYDFEYLDKAIHKALSAKILTYIYRSLEFSKDYASIGILLESLLEVDYRLERMCYETMSQKYSVKLEQVLPKQTFTPGCLIPHPATWHGDHKEPLKALVLAAAQALGIPLEKPKEVKPVTTRYTIPHGDNPNDWFHIEAMLQRDGTYKWTVRQFGNCLRKDGEWEFERSHSWQPADWMEQTRFDSAEEAMSHLEKAKEKGNYGPFF